MRAAAKWMTLFLALAAAGCAVTPRWTATPLSYVPTAINDAGVIVGNDATNGPVRDENGTVTVLPPLSGAKGPFTAVDVASNGAILGSTGDASFPGTFWLSGGIQLPIGAAPVGFFVPKAVNGRLAVAGSAFNAKKAYKWTPDATAYTELKLPPTLPADLHDTNASDINDAGSVVGFAIKIPSGPAHIIFWGPDATPAVLDDSIIGKPFSDPHILNNGDVYWANNGSILGIVGGTRTSQQPPLVDSLDAVSQAGRLAGTITVNGVRHGWTSYQGNVTFLDLPNAPAGHFFRPVDVNSCGNKIVGVHLGPMGEVVGGVLFSRRQLFAFQCDTPPQLAQ